MCSKIGNNEVSTNVSCEEKQTLRRIQFFYKEFMNMEIATNFEAYMLKNAMLDAKQHR